MDIPMRVKGISPQMKTKNNFVDFHAHIIPGADHGTSKNETTKKQLEVLSCAGIGKVVATPHFYPHKMLLEDFLARREVCIEKMKEILSEESPLVYPAAEVLLTPRLDEMKGLEKLCIKGTNCLLVEMPSIDFDTEMSNTLSNIKAHGLNPILAHIDRYPKENLDRIFSRGLLFQLNAPAFLSLFGSKKFFTYAEYNEAVALGSDIHEKDGYDEFDRACKKLAAKGSYDALMERSAAVLKNAKFINEKADIDFQC